MSRPTLADLEAAYRRVATGIKRAYDDACDFNAEAIVAALESDSLIVDAAFFVLIFVSLENRVNEAAASRLTRDVERQAIRAMAFDRRLELALPGDAPRDVRKEIQGWYGLRNDAAHGESIIEGYNIAAVLRRAKDLDAMVAEAERR